MIGLQFHDVDFFGINFQAEKYTHFHAENKKND